MLPAKLSFDAFPERLKLGEVTIAGELVVSLFGKPLDRKMHPLGIKCCLLTIFISRAIGCDGDLDNTHDPWQK